MLIPVGSFEDVIDETPAPASPRLPYRPIHAAPRRRRVRVIKLWFPSIADQVIFLGHLATVYRGRPWTRHLAVSIVRPCCAPKDKISQAIAIGRAVQRRVYYVGERPEIFQLPRQTWTWGYGDCDDYATTTASLCESIGIDCDVVGMKIDGRWRHAYAEAKITIPGRPFRRVLRIPLDGSLSRPVGSRGANPVTLALARGHRVEVFRVPVG